MSWFADWGAADWTEDVNAAALQAYEWTSQVATEKDWPDEWVDTADTLITKASTQDTAGDFWSTLASYWENFDAAAHAADVGSWETLGEAFASAGGASYTISDARESGSILGVVSGAAAATATDIGVATDPARSIWPWVAAGAVGLGLFVFASRFGR